MGGTIMATYSRYCIGFVFALLTGAILADAHVCTPGIFWRDVNHSVRISQILQKEKNSPNGTDEENILSDDRPILVTTSDDPPKNATEHDNADTEGIPGALSTPAIVPVALKPKELKSRKERGGTADSDRFQWRPALGESMLYTGIMHAFRFTTEAGTRDALNGPWFNNWISSVSEIRGWDDHDPFITNDLAHPMEGAIFGFIQQQNDPKYRNVMW